MKKSIFKFAVMMLAVSLFAVSCDDSGDETPSTELPSIKGLGSFDITQTQTISLADDFDQDGYTGDMRIEIAAPNGGIQNLNLTISSTNEEFMTSVTTMLGGTTLDLANLDPIVQATLTAMGMLPSGTIKGAKTIVYDFKGAISMLAPFGVGYDYGFAVEVIDGDAKTASATLAVTVIAAYPSDQPSIVGLENLDLTETQTISLADDFDQDGYTGDMRIEIAAPNGGIQNLNLTISSTNEEFMTSVTTMLGGATLDLANLDPTIQATLTAMGMLPSTPIKDATSIVYDFKGAISMLAPFGAGYDYSFYVEVVDGVEATASATLAVTVIAETETE